MRAPTAQDASPRTELRELRPARRSRKSSVVWRVVVPYSIGRTCLRSGAYQGLTRLPPGSPHTVLMASLAVAISPRTGIPHTRRYCPRRPNDGRLLNLLAAGHYRAIRLRIAGHLAKASTPLGGKGLQRRPATGSASAEKRRNYFVTIGHFACITTPSCAALSPGDRVILSACPGGFGRMADENDRPPLVRRVPGATQAGPADPGTAEAAGAARGVSTAYTGRRQRSARPSGP